jgi:zinc protease
MGTESFQALDLVTDILSRGKTSRLYKRLVYDEQVATNVSAYVDAREIASLLQIVVTAKPGEDLAKIETMVNEELTAFLKDGPTAKEVKRVQTQYVAAFVRGAERIGGFGGKSDILAMSATYHGSPDFYKTTLKRVQSMTPDMIKTAAQEWLSQGDHTVEVHPFPSYMVAPPLPGVRDKVPSAGIPPKATFPDIQRTTLSNGLKVIFAERDVVPIVNFWMEFDAGYASDQYAKPGTANMAMGMLDEGTKTRSALEMSDELSMLGASLGAGSNLDQSSVTMSALKTNLDASLELYADAILNPSFPAEDFERNKKQTLARIQREKATPIQMALRVFPKLLYGENHAYSNPLTGSGTEATVSAMTREDLVKFHATWIRPNNATLIVVGATTLNEIKPKLEKYFDGWKAADVPTKNIMDVELADEPAIYIMDKPGAPQSIIFAGHIAPPENNPDEIAIDMMNTALGGAFVSRINMNLREDKHWAYGAFSVLYSAKAQRPYFAYAPVQTDKTMESMIEITKELNDVVGDRPITNEELDRVQASKILELPGSWETINSVGGAINALVRYGYPDDYYTTYPEKVQAASLSDLRNAAEKLVQPENLIWVVVGDREKIEAGIRSLDYGEIKFLDGDGNVIQ